jgi:hypothetical protein
MMSPIVRRYPKWFAAATVLMWLSAPHPVRAQCDAPENMLYGMNIDPANPAGNPSAVDLQTVGARWVRVEWKVGGGYGFYDPIISALRAGGISVLLLVDYASCTAAGPGSGGSDPAWDTYIATFVSEVDAIAAHYGDTVDAWEVWNEPDLLLSGEPYDPGVPAHKYGIMLRDSYNAIRAHSTRPVVVGGLASGNPAYLTQAINAVGGLFADGVGVHPYGQRAPDDWPNNTWGFGNLSTFYNTYLQFGVPLWVTEIGTVDTVNQAQYLTNVYTLTRDFFLADVPVVFWFCWSDGMVSPFGILDGGGNPKQAYTNYQSMSPPWDPACSGPVDNDNDGHSTPADCDDNNPNIYPGAPEICGNGVDEDCSGSDLPCPDPDGGVIDPDGASIDPDGASIDPDGGSVDPDSTAIDPDATATDPDGSDPGLTNRVSGGCGCRFRPSDPTGNSGWMFWILLAALASLAIRFAEPRR